MSEHPLWLDDLARQLDVYPDTLHSQRLTGSTWHVAAPGSDLFVKTAAAGPLQAEAEGLDALHAGFGEAPVRLPHTRALGTDGTTPWLAVDWLPLTAPDAHSDALLGHALAELHRSCSAAEFGWPRDNFIGATPQRNTPSDSAAEFLRRTRLGPQLNLAAERGAPRELLDSGARLLEKLDAFYSDYRPTPALLHGDLWAGNHAATPDGLPAVYDPAVHYGDREADLAMSELFGGFAHDFHAAYREAWPLDPGYATRRDLHQLYHVLNHFNLFAGGYARQALTLIRRLLAACR